MTRPAPNPAPNRPPDPFAEVRELCADLVNCDAPPSAELDTAATEALPVLRKLRSFVRRPIPRRRR